MSDMDIGVSAAMRMQAEIDRLTAELDKVKANYQAFLRQQIARGDKLAYEVAKAVLRRDIRTRTALSDEVENYLDIGGPDACETVPEWVSNYEAAKG